MKHVIPPGTNKGIMFKEYLESKFKELHPASNPDAIEEAWQLIYVSYMESHRHYHTLEHIYNMFKELENVKQHIVNVPVVSMAIYSMILYTSQGQLITRRGAQPLLRLNWKS